MTDALATADPAYMLRLCSTEIDEALHDCDEAITRLLETFADVIDDAQWFWRQSAALGDETFKEDQVAARSARLVSRTNAAIQALQFHDRLAQRLGHVRRNLLCSQELSTDPAYLKLQRIREEVALLQALSQGSEQQTGTSTATGGGISPPASERARIEIF